MLCIIIKSMQPNTLGNGKENKTTNPSSRSMHSFTAEYNLKLILQIFKEMQRNICWDVRTWLHARKHQ